jgi:FkbH-like protein
MDTFFRDLSWLARPPADFQSLCRSLQSEPGRRGAEIRALASTALDENQLIRLAKIIQTAGKDGCFSDGLVPFRLGYISNGTPDFISAALIATAPRYGIALECVASGYDQSVQNALNPDSPINRFAPDGVLIAIDWRGLPMRSAPGQASEGTVDEVLGHLQTICNGIKSNGKATCIVQNIAAPVQRVLGSFDRMLPGAPHQVLDRVNLALGDVVRAAGDIMLDVAGLAETVGLANWHSAPEWNLAKLPFAQVFVPLYADYVCRTIAAIRGRSRRCLVLDLDNTLWGGVIGDDGLSGIHVAQGDAIGEAYLDFQRYILSLRQAGIVLAVSSKNEDEIARLPFREHREMLLREEHFAVFQANWNDKPTNLKAIATELSLGLESLVLVDDNPFERGLVRKTLPQVAVPEMPSDPALYSRTLSAAGYFEAISFSSEDSSRVSYYEGNAKRASLQKQVSDLESYLVSLEMEIWFQPFTATSRERITQLINKSNQFNLTTRRYTHSEVAHMESSPQFFTMEVRLKDIFGDNGMISVVICRVVSEQEWEVDTWLMSCRVLGRRVENMVLKEMLAHAAERGVRRLRGIYLPTERNKLVERHYANLGFSLQAEHADGSTEWQLSVTGASVEAAPMVMHSGSFAAR